VFCGVEHTVEDVKKTHITCSVSLHPTEFLFVHIYRCFSVSSIEEILDVSLFGPRRISFRC